jgi:RNA polymerase sigma-70 factor (ECF subfamily)
VTDGGGKAAAASNLLEGADRTAQFITLRFTTINGLPGIVVNGPEGAVQTAAFEIEGDVIRALYVVRTPDKLRHLTRMAPNESNLG